MRAGSPARALALAFVLLLTYAIVGSTGMTARADTEHSSLYVVGLNRLFWRRLYRVSETRYSLT